MPRNALQILAGLALISWLILPLIPLALWSFAHGWRFPDLLPRDLSLRAWTYALSDTAGVTASLALTTGIALSTTALAALIGIPAGRALGLNQFPGKAVVQMFLLAPALVPGIAVVFGLHGIFLNLGLAGTVPGVILAHLIPTLPYMTLVMAGVFANHDTAHEDQARSLGASRLQVFRHITLPAVLPGVVTGALFAFLVSWSQYLPTLVIGGGRVQTLPLLLFTFATSGRNDVMGAIALIYILPGLLILALTARHLTGRSPALAGAIPQ
jgi:putative spermidine/putrescine transport system permease protein